MIEPWFKKFPDRYTQELEELHEFCISCEIDKKAKRNGHVKLKLRVPYEDGSLDLIATYPINYPYFRPQVQAKDLSLARHQHPFGKNLCLLPRPTWHWNIDWTLCSYLKSQLGKVLETGIITDLEKISEDEYEQAEPFSDYYQYQPDSVVFIDSTFAIAKSIKGGKMVVGFPDKSTLLPKAALLRIEDDNGSIIHKLPSEIAKFFTREYEYNWHHLNEPLKTTSVSEAVETLQEKKLKHYVKSKRVNVKKGHIEDIIGIAFPEEHSIKEKGTGWLFIIKVKENKKIKSRSYFSPAKRIGKRDMFSRIPELNSLQDKKVSIAGLGCLGGPAAIEFAKAGTGELCLMDHDTIDPATVVRWPLGFQNAGSFKINQLGGFIFHNYPYTKVTGSVYKIGSVTDCSESIDKEIQIINSFTENASLIFDATAEIGVNHYLSHLAEQQEIPYVCIYGTNNGWGGVVSRIVPGKTEGCWMCLQNAIFDGDIPMPAEDPSQNIQPIGCADPTFTGSSFDLTNISLMGVKIAVSTLCSSTKGGYPEMDWDIGIVSFRDDNGKPIAPKWDTFQLNKHPKCEYCN